MYNQPHEQEPENLNGLLNEITGVIQNDKNKYNL
jgi:phosphoribosylformylglycinamidine (FGAM) synthase-like amidotransferase family enzyme